MGLSDLKMVLGLHKFNWECPKEKIQIESARYMNSKETKNVIKFLSWTATAKRLLFNVYTFEAISANQFNQRNRINEKHKLKHKSIVIENLN